MPGEQAWTPSVARSTTRTRSALCCTEVSSGLDDETNCRTTFDRVGQTASSPNGGQDAFEACLAGRLVHAAYVARRAVTQARYRKREWKLISPRPIPDSWCHSTGRRRSRSSAGRHTWSEAPILSWLLPDRTPAS